MEEVQPDVAVALAWTRPKTEALDVCCCCWSSYTHAQSLPRPGRFTVDCWGMPAPPTIWNTKPPNLPSLPAAAWAILTADPDNPRVLDTLGLLHHHKHWLDTREVSLSGGQSLREGLHDLLLPLWVKPPPKRPYSRHNSVRHPTLYPSAPPDVLAAFEPYRHATGGYDLPGKIRYGRQHFRRDLASLGAWVDPAWLHAQVLRIQASPPPLSRSRNLLARAGNALTLIDSRTASATPNWARVHSPKGLAERQALRRLYKLLPAICMWSQETVTVQPQNWEEMPKIIKDWERQKTASQQRQRLSSADWD